MEIEELTHEELARHAALVARRTNNAALLEAALDLQECVDAEADSDGAAARCIDLMRD